MILLNPFRLYPTVEKRTMRNGVQRALLELGQKNPNVVVLTADLAESTRVKAFMDKYPERSFECGIAEQNMMGIGAGLALSGKIPFISSYAVFSPGRNWDQLRVSVAYSNTNVKIIGSHVGLTVGADGATHQALEDIALTRVLPNLTVISPCDEEEAYKAILASAEIKGPVYIRLSRHKSPVITIKKTPFKIGKGEIFREGYDATLMVTGHLVHQALIAAESLAEQGIEVEVINIHTIKPLDSKTILKSLKKTIAGVVIEEHQINAGLYGAISELTAQKLPIPLESISVQDTFGESGEPEELLKKYHLTVAEIIKKTKKIIKRKGSFLDF